ncbi:MAG: LysM peptidoglycan-binding domain-containing protein [Paracoccaceae bacterium]|nr:LysM peptidoglycan-binding domain-containing protein [Paracoccaceae bacterium]
MDRDSCPTYRVVPGDTLSGIAARRLGSPSRYREIVAANPDTVSDPTRLRPGTRLTLPCVQAPAHNDDSVAGGRSPSQPPDATETSGDGGNGSGRRPGFLSRLFGTAPATEARHPEIAPAASAPEPPDPRWSADAGEYLIDVVERWGENGGFQVIIEDRGDWRFAVPFSLEGPLRLALREVIKGFGSGPEAPLIVLHANRVIRIGAAR